MEWSPLGLTWARLCVCVCWRVGDTDCLRAKRTTISMRSASKILSVWELGLDGINVYVHFVTFKDSVQMCPLFFLFITLHSGVFRANSIATFLMQKYRKLHSIFIWVSLYPCACLCISLSPYVCICLQLVYLPSKTGCVHILMAPPSPRLACNNEDSTFNNLDRQIKRGFNSYSSPWALHHWGRYPSAPLLSPFIVSSCQSLGGLAKWPLLLLRSCYCVLAYPLAGGERGTTTALSLNWRVGGVLLPGYHPTYHTRGVWWRLYEEVRLHNHVWAHRVLLVQTILPSRGWPCQSPLLPAFLWFLNKRSLRPSAIPFSCRARELAGLDPPLWVFTAALLAAFESSQPGLEAQRGKSNCSRRARITGETLRKRKKKKKTGKISWCKFRRHIAWRRGTELKKSFSMPGIASEVRLLICYFCHYHF